MTEEAVNTRYLCTECNVPYDYTTHGGPRLEERKKHKRCFTCDFWVAHFEDDLEGERDGRGFVYDERHYFANPMVDATNTTHFLGFGGRAWKITFEDGEVIETNNLWCQGYIPQRFLKLFDKLPNKCISLEDKGYYA